MELSPSWEAASCLATQEFLAFYGIRRFITPPQEPFTGPYNEPEELSPYHPNQFLKDEFFNIILSPIYRPS
jgi:hypothetical protein